MVEQSSDDSGAEPEGARGVPVTIRGAGAAAALEGAIGVIVAIVLIVRGASGVDHSTTNSYGTAAWFVIFGGAVLAAGIALFVGKRWGRAIAVIAGILLLPAAWYMISSHQPQFGIPLGLLALIGLGLLFSPPASRWMAQGYDSSIGASD